MEGLHLRRCLEYVTEKRWKDYRYELHQYFKKFKSTEEARQHPYENVTQDAWDWLCTIFDKKDSELLMILLVMLVRQLLDYLQKRPIN